MGLGGRPVGEVQVQVHVLAVGMEVPPALTVGSVLAVCLSLSFFLLAFSSFWYAEDWSTKGST